MRRYLPAVVLLPVALAVLGVDVSEPVTPANAACLAAGGVKFGITRAWHSTGTFDPASLTTLKSFASNNITGDVYLFPCSFGQTAASQMSEVSGVALGRGEGDLLRLHR